MKTLFELSQRDKEAAAIPKEEEIWYCVPYDLEGDTLITDGYMVVTEKRVLFLRSGVKTQEYLLSEITKIRCESGVNSGIVSIWKGQEIIMAARCTLRHVERVSCAARGAQMLLEGKKIRVESMEKERYCPKCGRALVGANNCAKCDDKQGIIKRFMELCQGSGKMLVLIAIVMFLSSLAGILLPQVQRTFIDDYLRPLQGGMGEVLLFTLVTATLTGLSVGMNLLRNWWCSKLGSSVAENLRKKLYEKIQLLSMTSIGNRKPGELLNRIGNDTKEIRQFVVEIFGRLFSTVFVMVMTLSYMIYLNPFLTFVSVVLTSMAVILSRIFWKRIHRIFGKLWRKHDKLESNLQDTISGIRVVKSFGKEKEEAAKFCASSRELTTVRMRNEKFWAVFYPCLTFFMSVGTYLVVYFGGSDVLKGIMTVGQLVQFIAYTNYLYGPISWMTHLPRGVMQMITCMNRVYDILDEEPRLKDREDAREIEIKGDVEFEDMSFGYHSYEPVLEHINLKVKAGEMIGLVGPSGAGKSTVINMIMRLYDADMGTIKIDGIDIRDISQECLHRQIGVVLQETFLFSGTVLENLRFAKPEASLEEIIQATKAANAHDFISKLPDGYHTWIGEKGHTLSGGERQRIAIARAVLTDPKLLILDEATSALDTESEYLIQQALERLTKGRTTFAIAHRLSTLRSADRLVVIDRHKIAEMGTHNELLEQKGIYYGLVMAQLEMAKTAE